MAHNQTKYAYPKRNASVKLPKPKYSGRMLWGMKDHRIKCRDCTHYASHEAIVKRVPNALNMATEATVPFCENHANKSIATGELTRVKPYDEFLAWQRELKKWESVQGSEVQGILV